MIKRSRNGRNGNAIEAPETAKVVRCGIYTRKSTEEGLQNEFNSLDAQREACQAYIASQRQEGWIALETRYDDGGFTGANTDRPAVQRLLKDIEAGLIDAVVIYKIDRLSRSLLDFAHLMALFERKNVALVSVTQQFSTANSMGRLTLNILMSFAEFERQMISERTKDKLSAARRKGKWLGGTPILGYTVETEPKRRLVVVPEEAFIVREMFRLYVQRQSLLDVAREAKRRGWKTKPWKTKEGNLTGGRDFDKMSVQRLLSAVTYIGKVDYEGEIFEGEHEAIVTKETFREAQSILAENRQCGGSRTRNKYGALLRGKLYCGACGKAMSHTYTMKPGKLYRYYVCNGAQKNGFDTCPTGTIPAQEIENFLVRQLRSLDKNQAFRDQVLAQAQEELRSTREKLYAEKAQVRQELATLREEARSLAMTLSEANGGKSAILERMGEIERHLAVLEHRESDLQRAIDEQSLISVSKDDFRKIGGMFDNVWEMLTTRERIRVIEILVDRVTYDGGTNRLDLKLSPAGLILLRDQTKRLTATKYHTP